MALLDFSTVPNAILIGWMRSLLTGNQEDADGFLTITKMSQSAQQASLQTYLNARITSNTAQSTLLSSAATDAQSSLTSDTSTCNSLLTTLSS
jgi:hypothetical protein